LKDEKPEIVVEETKVKDFKLDDAAIIDVSPGPSEEFLP